METSVGGLIRNVPSKGDVAIMALTYGRFLGDFLIQVLKVNRNLRNLKLIVPNQYPGMKFQFLIRFI